MNTVARAAAWRVLPVIFVHIAAGFWIDEVQSSGPYVIRNLIPLAILLLLATLTLLRGAGRWTGSGVRMLLGTIGFSIPALGLSAYLHYAFSVNLNELFTSAEQSVQVFRYLPLYTTGAGGIGFLIGWIIGRNAQDASTKA